MKIQIHAPWEVNATLKTSIKTKLEKLAKYYQRIFDAEVFLKLEDSEKPDGKVLEVRLHLPIKDVFAKATSDTYEKALAKTVGKLEQQLKKRKDKLTNKRAVIGESDH